MKSDTGKPQWWLLRGMIPAVDYVMLVREYGVKKYKDPDNWLTVENGHRRYIDAACRHLACVIDGQNIDPESGLLHLGHAACSVLFALAFALRGMASTEPRWGGAKVEEPNVYAGRTGVSVPDLTPIAVDNVDEPKP